MCRTSTERQLRTTRYASVVIGFLPLPFVFLVPSILKMQFFTRGIRTAITLVALASLYFPFFSSSRGATGGLIITTIMTSVWFFLGNPYGIDNIYVAVVTPLLVMAIDHLLHRPSKGNGTDAQQRVVHNSEGSHSEACRTRRQTARESTLRTPGSS